MGECRYFESSTEVLGVVSPFQLGHHQLMKESLRKAHLVKTTLSFHLGCKEQLKSDQSLDLQNSPKFPKDVIHCPVFL